MDDEDVAGEQTSLARADTSYPCRQHGNDAEDIYVDRRRHSDLSQ